MIEFDISLIEWGILLYIFIVFIISLCYFSRKEEKQQKYKHLSTICVQCNNEIAAFHEYMKLVKDDTEFIFCSLKCFNEFSSSMEMVEK